MSSPISTPSNFIKFAEDFDRVSKRRRQKRQAIRAAKKLCARTRDVLRTTTKYTLIGSFAALNILAGVQSYYNVAAKSVDFTAVTGTERYLAPVLEAADAAAVAIFDQPRILMNDPHYCPGTSLVPSTLAWIGTHVGERTATTARIVSAVGGLWGAEFGAAALGFTYGLDQARTGAPLKKPATCTRLMDLNNG